MLLIIRCDISPAKAGFVCGKFMYLEKLEIQGFKSFANKNKLIFSGLLNGHRRGITVVVGPNGSGKSNIADAIRWVLGEQSTKLLRSKKSEDVIFSGSDKKSRLNMAEVSLYLNNENTHLFNYNKEENDVSKPKKNGRKGKEIVADQAEMSANNEIDNIDALLFLPEIVLTRKVFRDGNSEYFINNNRVRLSDIQIFLAKANFGQKTYSVIGQGMVENFLNTSPAERKAFFDEATGVKQYQIKRDLSLNKLETSQENLSKVEMLLNEIEPRLKSLTRQVNKLKKRQFLEEELLQNQLTYYNRLWQDIDDKSQELKSNISKINQEKDSLARELEEKKKRLNDINQGETVGEEFYELQKRFLFLKSEQDRAQKQLEKINYFKALKLEEKNKNGQDDLEKLNKEKLELVKLIETSLSQVDELNQGFLKQDLLEKSETDLSQLVAKMQEKRGELSKIEAWIEVKLEKQGKFDVSFLNGKKIEIKSEIEILQHNLNELTTINNEKSKKIDNLQKIKNDLESQLKKIEQEINLVNIEDSPKNVEKINSSLGELIKKIEKNKNSGDFALLKKIIIEVNEELKGLLNFSSGKNYQSKITSLNSKLENLREEQNKVVDDIYVLRLEYDSAINKQKNWQEDIAKKEKELINLFEKIKISEQDDSSKDLTQKKQKLEKDLEELNQEIFQKRDEVLHLKIAKDNWQDERLNNQRILQKRQNELSEINDKINSLSSSSLKNQSRLEDLEAEINANKFSPDKMENFDNFLEVELNFVSIFSEETNEEMAILQGKIDNFNQEQENKKRSVIELQKDINDLDSKINQLESDFNENNINLAKEETRLEDLENNILDDKLDLETIKIHQFDGQIEINIIKDAINRTKSQLDLIGGIDPETEKEYEETKKRFDFLFEQTEDLNKTIKSLEKVIIELDSVIKERFDAEFKIISQKFNEYFRILFNGGNAKIFPLRDNEILDENKNIEISKDVVAEKDSDNKTSVSEKNSKLIKYLKKYNAIGLSGVDISATPPGKKISSISMLSGGERALTAIALICAIISANPSPFVVLDEVDAALDEANSERLAKILDDLSSKTQFIAISHNRATMRRANILYGVTMQDDGVSKLLSVKLDEKLI